MSNHFSYSDPQFNIGRGTDWEPDQSRYSMHAHSRAEIFHFIRGNGIFHIEGSEYVMESGDVLIMSPSESHYIELDCSQPYERTSIHFCADMFQTMDPERILMKPFLDRKPGVFNLYKGYEFGGGSCKHYWQTMESQEGNTRLNVITGMMSLLNEIYTIYMSREEDAHIAGNTLEHQIIRYINNNLASTVSLDEICQKYYISKSQLCRMFKKATGTTIWQYITIKRLAQARVMLREGEKPTKVYSVCGFNDYSAFYRAYMKRYGHGPNQE